VSSRLSQLSELLLSESESTASSVEGRHFSEAYKSKPGPTSKKFQLRIFNGYDEIKGWTPFNPLTPAAFCKKHVFGAYWRFSDWISAKLASIYSQLYFTY